jgi:hypothetical protein
MRPIAFDTETYLIYKDGKATKNMCPRLVCLSWSDGESLELLERERAVPLFRSWLEAGDVTFIGLNLAFDMAVMARALGEEYPDEEQYLFNLIYKASKHDVGIDSKLLDISLGGMFLRGTYSLAAQVQRWMGETMGGKKAAALGPDVWRLRYNELDGVKAEDYPTAAYEYALRDAEVTWGVYEKQQRNPNLNRGAVRIRSQYAFDLHLMSCWGLMIDEAWVHAIKAHYDKQKEKYLAMLSTPCVDFSMIIKKKPVPGLYAPIQDGIMKVAVKQEVIRRAWASVGETPIFTPAGGIKTDAKVFQELEKLGVTEPLFQMYSAYQRATKFLSTYVEPLMDAGAGPICPRYSETKESGRTSSSGPNVQNMPSRINKVDSASLDLWAEQEDPEDEDEPIDRLLAGFVVGPDIRGAFIPRPGCVFVAADYTAAEMAGLAQVCANNNGGKLGTLGQAINAGLDLHVYVAAKLMKISYKECKALVDIGDIRAKELRQIAKIANFGFAGGASAQTFVDYAAGFGVTIKSHDAVVMKEAWLEAWTEMPQYFRFISACETGRKTFHVEQHGPNGRTTGWRLRVTNRYTAAANTLFQGIVADGALLAVHMVVEACFTQPESPLFGCRPLLFIHDELVLECPADRAEECAVELSRLMVKGMKVFLPDLNVEASPTIMTVRWAK